MFFFYYNTPSHILLSLTTTQSRLKAQFLYYNLYPPCDWQLMIFFLLRIHTILYCSVVPRFNFLYCRFYYVTKKKIVKFLVSAFDAHGYRATTDSSLNQRILSCACAAKYISLEHKQIKCIYVDDSTVQFSLLIPIRFKFLSIIDKKIGRSKFGVEEVSSQIIRQAGAD